MKADSRKSVLIVDDTEVNRAILADILSDEYDIIEAEDGVQAIEILRRTGSSITLLLLDIIMPQADGFDVLRFMRSNDMLDYIPVVIISAETSFESIRRSFEYGVVDYISRPFDPEIVLQRVRNAMMLYMKQTQLRSMVVERLREKERNSVLMTDILSTIIEFRNSESGSRTHIARLRAITEILLEAIRERRPEYGLSDAAVSVISNAVALHDVGNIVLPEELLNKPEGLTPEETDELRLHAAAGANILDSLYFEKDEPLVRYARQICRWHHERWDGSGYPDGLKGDEIPVAAQAVGLADVYDELTSERAQNPPLSSAQAVSMIQSGERGAFNPDFIECLLDVGGELEEKIRMKSRKQEQVFGAEQFARRLTEHGSGPGVSDRTLFLLERERLKYQFLASLSNETLFDYDVRSDVITFSEHGEAQLGLPKMVAKCAETGDTVTAEIMRGIKKGIEETTEENPNLQTKLLLMTKDNGEQWYEMNLRTLWMHDHAEPVIYSCIGSLKNIHSQTVEHVLLQEMATKDSLTKLYNTSTAKAIVTEALSEDVDGYSAMMLMDLDDFKGVNDNYGHQFGDDILLDVSRLISANIRKTDVAARVGGDEFMIFLRQIVDRKTLEEQCLRIMRAMNYGYGNYQVNVSAGIAIYPEHGTDYATLFKRADQALYSSKNQGRNRCTYYTEDITEFKSTLSPLDSDKERHGESHGQLL